MSLNQREASTGVEVAESTGGRGKRSEREQTWASLATYRFVYRLSSGETLAFCNVLRVASARNVAEVPDDVAPDTPVLLYADGRGPEPVFEAAAIESIERETDEATPQPPEE
ncbi:MAG: hypothetical protein ACI9CA_002049 [Natronomonas sp.]|jgi:hypothetical protein